MLSYENPAGEFTPGDFQGITYDTPRSGINLLKAAGVFSSGGFKSDIVPGKTYLRRFSLEIRVR